MASERAAETAAAGQHTIPGSRFQELIRKASEMKPEEMLHRHNGLLYPSVLCTQHSLEQFDKFEARPEDMCIVSYPKCGFNWVNQLFRGIACAVQNKPENENEGRPEIVILEFANADKHQLKLGKLSTEEVALDAAGRHSEVTAMGRKDRRTGGDRVTEVTAMEWKGAQAVARNGKQLNKVMKNWPSPRVYGTHFHYENLPASIIEKKTKILVVFRNPKDAAVSYYHFCEKNPLLPSPTSWDDFFKNFMAGEVAWGSYFDYALIWEKHIDDENVMVMTYEELKEDLAGGVQKIAEFYGFSLSEEQIRNIADKGSFQVMRDNSQKTHFTLGNVFFRKGVIGDWRNLFTEEQSREMDAKFEGCLAGTKLGARLKYDLYCKA